jgi:hypothetical protein
MTLEPKSDEVTENVPITRITESEVIEHSGSPSNRKKREMLVSANGTDLVCAVLQVCRHIAIVRHVRTGPAHSVQVPEKRKFVLTMWHQRAQSSIVGK